MRKRLFNVEDVAEMYANGQCGTFGGRLNDKKAEMWISFIHIVRRNPVTSIFISNFKRLQCFLSVGVI